MFCGRICDMNHEGICLECQERIRQTDLRCYGMELLQEAARWVGDKHLRDKIDRYIITVKSAATFARCPY
jgi:hypothetical protein